MTFFWPHLLWLLVLPAGLLAWELLRRRRLDGISHPKILRAEAGMTSVSLSGEEPGASPSRRRFLLCAGIAFGILALARPQWGRIDEPVFDQSRDIIIALDLSRSMLTPDVKPSRLERSKLLIQALLDHLKGERVGLIIFSGTAFLQSPVSADYEILREFLPTLGPDFLPEGGTNYRQLIDTALEAFAGGSAADRYLIILSDGEATDDNWKDRIPDLTKKGIRVIGLGVGTHGGGMIPDGAGSFMKDENGAVVLSKLESGTLRDLAAATHGVYRDASEWVDLSKVLASTVEQGKKGRFVEHNSARYAERYQWALAQALVCLIASFWLEFPVRAKSREMRLSAPAGPARRAAAAATACLATLLFFGATRLAAADATLPDPAAALSKMVGRLSAEAACSAQDWAELGQETVTWGQHIKSGSKPVPEGPVRDALQAVDTGERSEPKASDWPRLRSELEDLLKKPDDKDQKQQNKDQDQKQNQKQDQKKDQDKDQEQDKKKDQQQDQKQDKQQSQDQQGSKPDKPQESKDQNDSQQNKPADEKQQGKESAFGDMGKAAPTPPPPKESHGSMQKVGGVKKDQPADPARDNPELAVPLEKLEQLKSQDSPAELFGMLRKGEPTPPPANAGKNW